MKVRLEIDMEQNTENMILMRMSELGEKHKTTMMKIAIAWFFCKKGIDMPVIKVDNSEKLIQGSLAVTIKLDSEEMQYLEESAYAE